VLYQPQTPKTDIRHIGTYKADAGSMKQRNSFLRKTITTIALSAALLVPAITQAQPMPNPAPQPVQVVTAPAQPHGPQLDFLVPAILAVVVIGSILHDHDL